MYGQDGFARIRRQGNLECAALCRLASRGLYRRRFLKVFGRPRAYDAMEDVVPLVARPRDLAFPSTHAADAFSVAVIVLLARPSVEGIVAMVLAILTGYSRIHVGVHYLTDVIGGAVFGSICAVACYALMLRV